jgi:hypothetical protein
LPRRDSSTKTVAKWVELLRAEGADDSRPHSLPGQTPPARCAQIDTLRRQRMTAALPACCPTAADLANAWAAHAANVEKRSARAAIEDRHAETNFARFDDTDPAAALWNGRSSSLPKSCVCGGNPEMNSTVIIGLIALAAILAGAFAGVKVRERLPKHHLTDETKSLVSVSTAAVV